MPLLELAYRPGHGCVHLRAELFCGFWRPLGAPGLNLLALELHLLPQRLEALQGLGDPSRGILRGLLGRRRL